MSILYRIEAEIEAEHEREKQALRAERDKAQHEA